MIQNHICFDATAIVMSSEVLLVASAGRDGMVRVWDMFKVPTRGCDSTRYGNETFTISRMRISGIGELGEGNDDDNGNDDSDDDGPPPRLVSWGKLY